ncbi:transposase [Mycolicibacterium phlei]|uniref:transposase n=1 Tax=Mycolicibacterium phlei TaxID=1771 RepID=UPI000A2F7325|nr:transposase [Mycolicibacterium phlei]
MAVDWSKRGDYIAKRRMTPALADEALADPNRLVLDPDPASTSGVSVRTIGFSPSFGGLISVITVEDGGTVWGVNAWPSNDVDTRKYMSREGERDG